MVIKNLLKWQRRNWLKDHYNNIDEYVLKYYTELSSYLKTKPISFKKIPKLDCNSFSLTILDGSKYYRSGRYAKTFLKNNDKIIKVQRVKCKRCLKELIKEIYIAFFLSNKHKLAPFIHNVGICFNLKLSVDAFQRDKRQSMYMWFEMDLVPYLFFDLFPDDYIDSLSFKNSRKKFIKSKYFNQFNLAIKMCIGAIEILLLENIYYGDMHDGNIGWDENGKILFFDFGRSRILNENCPDEHKLNLLYEELIYFRDMYFLDSKLINMYAIYEESHLYDIIHNLENDRYSLGSHIKWLDKKLDVKFVENY